MSLFSTFQPPISYSEPLFRPPAEANSLIFQVSYGCPHNSCKFCMMYKDCQYKVREKEALFKEINAVADYYQYTPKAVKRIFLADGDVMNLPTKHLVEILELLNEKFLNLSRIGIYANASSINKKSDEELKKLRHLKLTTLYTGLESGTQFILDNVAKGETVEENITAIQRAQSFNFKCSVMVLLGLGGQKFSEQHALATAEALNKMQPRILSALRYIGVAQSPHQKLYDDYSEVSESEALRELYLLLKNLDLNQTVFSANHSSNPLPIQGRLPKDKNNLLAQIKMSLDNNLYRHEKPFFYQL
ncbi:radical SAM protein [Lentisphaerota bacterium WC36G]|nr:radical SAM protein [Lentisphaerae bacterium WC36]